jgi:hypothetical protein
VALLCPFSSPGVQSVPSSRKWAIGVPAGFAVWISIDSNPAGGAKKQVESALLQPGKTYVFQSSVSDLFLSGRSTDPGADVVPTPITFIDSGAGNV